MKLAILGASGHGKVCAEVAEKSGYNDVVFYDDRWPAVTKLEHWSVEGDTGKLLATSNRNTHVFVAIGDNYVRKEKLNLLISEGFVIASLIHPKATISKYSTIGQGSVVMANVAINGFSQVGMGCIINTNTSIDHDCLVDHWVHISPGAHLGGGVKVGKLTWIGIGANIKHFISIGDQATVGGGAMVISNVAGGKTVVGVPAVMIKKEN